MAINYKLKTNKLKSKTLFDKIWDAHVVKELEDGTQVLYIDKHFIHEVTSPQAFNGIRERRLEIFRPDKTLAVADHNIPTIDQHLPIKEKQSANQIQALTDNCKKHNIKLYGIGHENNGIVHVIGPELGITQAGMTIVCGDSHTSTHGAFGSVAFGIGTSEVEMVFASQCVLQRKPKTMRITIDGVLQKDVTSKDIILYVISKLTSGGGTGYFIEFTGSAIKNLSMEARMTVCNMSIELGARGGLIAPDETTFDYIKNREFSQKGYDFRIIKQNMKELYSDKYAIFEKEYIFKAEDIEPMITYGTNPGTGIPVNEKIPESANAKTLEYMNFKRGQSLIGQKINYVFLGSCTNGRYEDFKIFADIVKGKKKADNVTAWLVPGSKKIEKKIKENGIGKILKDAGFEIRQPGCSACLAMNEDKIPSGEYCVSTSNRNFEGRQGPGARTLLAGPVLAGLAAVTGKITMPSN